MEVIRRSELVPMNTFMFSNLDLDLLEVEVSPILTIYSLGNYRLSAEVLEHSCSCIVSWLIVIVHLSRLKTRALTYTETLLLLLHKPALDFDLPLLVTQKTTPPRIISSLGFGANGMSHLCFARRILHLRSIKLLQILCLLVSTPHRAPVTLAWCRHYDYDFLPQHVTSLFILLAPCTVLKEDGVTRFLIESCVRSVFKLCHFLFVLLSMIEKGIASSISSFTFTRVWIE
eukprot:scaffold283_cov81-Skeletonema_marinoi.AAC.1